MQPKSIKALAACLCLALVANACALPETSQIPGASLEQTTMAECPTPTPQGIAMMETAERQRWGCGSVRRLSGRSGVKRGGRAHRPAGAEPRVDAGSGQRRTSAGSRQRRALPSRRHREASRNSAMIYRQRAIRATRRRPRVRNRPRKSKRPMPRSNGASAFFCAIQSQVNRRPRRLRLGQARTSRTPLPSRAAPA